MKTVNLRELPKHTVTEVIKGLSRNTKGGSYPEVSEKTGYIVAVSREFDAIAEVVDAYDYIWSKDDKTYFGWYTHKDGRKVYEFSIWFRVEHYAILAGRAKGQYSIWDIKNKKEIVL